jgi:O-acetyl-ADP-ribose deacetylase (regulator of RNase III)
MKLIEKNILDVTGPAVICHQVNCLGVMGAGLALQIRREWENVYNVYVDKDDWQVGDCQLVTIGDAQFVANLAGQQNVGGGVQTDYNGLCQAFRQARDFTRANDIQLYIPHMMGCGLAGGDWDVVVHMLEDIAPETIICKLP